MKKLFKKLVTHPGLAAALGAMIALIGQQAFNKVFEGFYGVITERAQFPMLLRQIEYYRHISDPCSVQVRNTIESFNARIEYEHEANRQWFLIDWASTDKWNDVKPIALDCRPPFTLPPGFVFNEPLTLPPTPSALDFKK